MKKLNLKFIKNLNQTFKRIVEKKTTHSNRNKNKILD